MNIARPNGRISRVLIAATVAASLAGAASSAAATYQSTAGMPCRGTTCVQRVIVGTSYARFISPQTFYLYKEQVYARLVAHRRDLTLQRTFGAGGCSHVFKGSGIKARVDACGNEAPLTVIARRPRKARRIQLAIVYSSAPSAPGASGAPTVAVGDEQNLLAQLLLPVSALLGL